MFGSRVIVKPPVEPLSLIEAKVHLRYETDEQDELISALITAAREYTEDYCRLSLVTQMRELVLDTFYTNPAYYPWTRYYFAVDPIELPNGPLQEVTAVVYVDQNGVEQSLDASTYLIDINASSGWVKPAWGNYWPQPRYQSNAVSIRYIAGFPPVEGSPTDYTANIPAGLKIAMKLLIGHWFENREAVGPNLAELPLGVAAFLNQYRTSWL
jgi:uncharacterized phiE125 gp8 family phage protein